MVVNINCKLIGGRLMQVLVNINGCLELHCYDCGHCFCEFVVFCFCMFLFLYVFNSDFSLNSSIPISVSCFQTWNIKLEENGILSWNKAQKMFDNDMMNP